MVQARTLTLPNTLFNTLLYITVQPHSADFDTHVPVHMIDEPVAVAKVADFFMDRSAGWRIPIGGLPSGVYGITFHYDDNIALPFYVTPHIMMTRYDNNHMWRRLAAGKYLQLSALVGIGNSNAAAAV